MSSRLERVWEYQFCSEYIDKPLNRNVYQTVGHLDIKSSQNTRGNQLETTGTQRMVKEIRQEPEEYIVAKTRREGFKQNAPR